MSSWAKTIEKPVNTKTIMLTAKTFLITTPF
jgi:hypothetical protein